MKDSYKYITKKYKNYNYNDPLKNTEGKGNKLIRRGERKQHDGPKYCPQYIASSKKSLSVPYCM